MMKSVQAVACIMYILCPFVSSDNMAARLALGQSDALRGKIRDVIIDEFTKWQNTDILMEPSVDKCIEMVLAPKLVSSVTHQVIESEPEINEDVIHSMVNRTAVKMCNEEAEHFRKAKRHFNKYSEHIRNEIEDQVLQQGINRKAYEVETLNECKIIMKEAVDELHRDLDRKYHKQPQLKKLLTFLCHQSCASYLSDKRDL